MVRPEPKAAETEPPQAAPPPQPEAPDLPEAPPAEPETDAEILARLDLPDPDTLVKGDDFTRFLRAPLPHHLRSRALRRLWRTNPVLANLDGLNDYDTDFTGGSVPMGTLKTAYEVGRGFAGKVMTAAEADESDREPQVPDDAEDTGGADAVDEDFASAATNSQASSALEPSEIPDDAEDPETLQDGAEVRTNRRMAFRFDE